MGTDPDDKDLLDDIEHERDPCEGCGQQYICLCCLTCGAPPGDKHSPTCDDIL
jgi:hypothetical protein